LKKGHLAQVGKLTELLSPKIKAYEVQLAGLPVAGQDELKKITTRMVVEKNLVGGTLVDETKVPVLLEIVNKYKAQLIALIPQKESLEEIFIQEVKGK
jgi:hypothetical protein